MFIFGEKYSSSGLVSELYKFKSNHLKTVLSSPVLELWGAKCSLRKWKNFSQ